MKILIVDDEPLIRRSLEKVFTNKGHKVILAEDGLQGVEKWKSEKPEAVILDVLMPGLTGPEVISEVSPDTKVSIILISAYSGHYDLESIKGLGADLFIEKPFENILSVVDEMEKLIASKKN